MAGLEPDLLGESLVASVLKDRNTVADYLDRVFKDAPPPAIRSGFVLLGRLSLRGEPLAGEWLARLLNADVGSRLRPAFDAAISLAEESAYAPLG
jgi:hypothetical protein